MLYFFHDCQRYCFSRAARVSPLVKIQSKLGLIDSYQIGRLLIRGMRGEGYSELETGESCSCVASGRQSLFLCGLSRSAAQV
jgi:hypothetical protein